MSTRMLGNEWIVRYYIGWRGERNILYKSVEIFPYKSRFKNLEGKLKKESSNRIIFASGEFGLL